MVPFCSCSLWSLNMARITPAAATGPRADSVRIRVATLAAALRFPLDFAFVASGQAVLAGNGGDRRHQRRPSPSSFDFVEAQQQPGMKAVAHGAHVPPDPAAVKNHGFIRSHHVFFQFGFETLAGPNAADVELVIEADEKRGSVGDGVGRSRRLLIVILIAVVVRSWAWSGTVAKAKAKHQKRHEPSKVIGITSADAPFQPGWM